MNLLISTKDSKVYINPYKFRVINCFTEYKMNYDRINIFPLENINNLNSNNINNLLLVPFTHINNIWHLMHHLFITYKYIYINKYNSNRIYPIFFKNFYERQGNILNCQYKDLIFQGMGFSYEYFNDMYNNFSNNNSIKINKLDIVNEKLNFNKEELIDNFKIHILSNFNIKYKKNNNKIITFILRRGTRELTNIEYIKKKLSNVNYIYLEDYSVKKQLEIISNTDILIGLHGAGLSWCIFMKKNSLLIEMYPGNSNTDNYIRWCRIANINYKRMSINITNGNIRNFRNTTVHMNDNQLNELSNLL